MINGKQLKDAMMSAAISIANKKRSVDELNVYPVPDGDTGTNMSMTMGAALRALELMGDDVTVAQVADTAASALLRGARGNSGVILSLLFRGISKGLAGMAEADCEAMANALELGVSAAYKAVMKPTEGTILTVARLASVKAQECVHTTNDPVILWEEVCKEAEAALEKTPDMLPVLKKAGVVDAGGQGLVLIFKAMLEVFQGGGMAVPAEKAKEEKQIEFSTAVGEFDEVINFTYCTEFIVQKNPDSPDASKLRAYLETIGDCVVVVDDEEIIKVHVHTDSPGMALTKALEFGIFINDPKPKIENMRIQHENKVLEAKITKQQEFRPAEPEKEFGFVAVAAGLGVESMFTDLGVDQVVRGGQTMNPSTDDILKAITATPAKTVFVLPNNKNIIMAAEQAIKLADRNVCVLQTRTIPQGISAMLAFDPDASLADNRINMTKAFERVSTGQITFAARDSDYEGHQIKKGEILALDNSRLSFTDKDVEKATVKLTRRLVKGDTSYVTLIYGADVTDEQAEHVQALLSAKLSDKIEVMLVNGGQPVYYYIISVE
ncbi:DAK2 domain-containing protein [Ruminococcus sp.]|uniref:DAK2 domain-containing protein n=1 Tax=Ruminococcus sp. TaxID=41978 RepID=UPI0025F5F457|nr:DAK2 domain-containing protein [Ruminococcus sp.]MCI5816194.1 DAK2 domain-containing protein [Ruminococcus sp.]MDD7556772.1 DAK2 domain-containing protein [Ruminococcus sp.]MDY4963865.1 DAK2 domain-containing protein [Ruminococcus callidus]